MGRNIIPDGYELLAGRNRKNAQKALATAEERGLDVSLVRTVQEGYLIPGAEPESARSETPDDKWKVAEIDEWAGENLPDVELSGNKADKIAAVNKALKAKADSEKGGE